MSRQFSMESSAFAELLGPCLAKAEPAPRDEEAHASTRA